ncbi:MAG TPA: sodium:proton antiporter [Pirellulales bacterium]|jgi:Na+/H+ antiporter NhaD/arsenite permease-like protein|nr:sodium:proton antiporter [Pirellulales bacterium]
MQRLLYVGALAAALLVIGPSVAAAAEHESGEKLGLKLPFITMLPFAAMLASIAVLPLAAEHWWEHNKNKGIIVAALSIPLAAYLVGSFGDQAIHELAHKMMEYVSFIVLLASLFIISGGICVRGSLSGTPLVNTGVLALGAVLASIIGTTGASVLLIRPLLRANRLRKNKTHVVIFFIFIVSNCGGLLTPLGDPPLFLGFLKGVPFTWTLMLWPAWLVINGALLVIFNVWDQVAIRREEQQCHEPLLEEVTHHRRLHVAGMHNFVFLLGIVATIMASGAGMGFGGNAWPYGIQEGLMVALAAAAYFTTSDELRKENHFSAGPIIEVAVLFVGIFVTMTPALALLDVHGPALAKMGMQEPSHFFWASGILSSFLDNAPTYLTFAVTACAVHGVPTEGVDRYLADFLALPPEHHAAELLAAVSCGAVFMGANTYIGNGPNFMVKAIAEHGQVKMPSFFGYMLYSGCILIPLFIVATFLFFQ